MSACVSVALTGLGRHRLVLHPGPGLLLWKRDVMGGDRCRQEVDGRQQGLGVQNEVERGEDHLERESERDGEDRIPTPAVWTDGAPHSR